MYSNLFKLSVMRYHSRLNIHFKYNSIILVGKEIFSRVKSAGRGRGCDFGRPDADADSDAVGFLIASATLISQSCASSSSP